MQIELTDEARELLLKRGGTLTIDYLRAVGWGKVAEVSVDTNVKGKNLAPYRRLSVPEPDLKVLITPQLSGLASRMRIGTKGLVRKGFTVELGSDDPTVNACDI